MSAFKIATKGLLSMTWDDGGLVKALNRSQKGVRPAATKAMKRAGEMLAKKMQDNLRGHGKGGGALEASIGYELTDRRGRQSLIAGPIKDASVDAYALVIEYGRRPGKPPPRGALLPWMAAHGIPPEAEYPIRMSIATNGLRGQPFPYIEPAAAQMGVELDDLGGDIIDVVWREITT